MTPSLTWIGVFHEIERKKNRGVGNPCFCHSGESSRKVVGRTRHASGTCDSFPHIPRRVEVTGTVAAGDYLTSEFLTDAKDGIKISRWWFWLFRCIYIRALTLADWMTISKSLLSNLQRYGYADSHHRESPDNTSFYQIFKFIIFVNLLKAKAKLKIKKQNNRVNFHPLPNIEIWIRAIWLPNAPTGGSNQKSSTLRILAG